MDVPLKADAGRTHMSPKRNIVAICIRPVSPECPFARNFPILSGLGSESVMRVPFALLFLPLLGGCLARTAVDIVTLPVKAVGAGVDAVTTSQSEADRKRGREIREQEERAGRAARRAEQERLRQEREGWQGEESPQSDWHE
jgi:hypothetical protein